VFYLYHEGQDKFLLAHRGQGILQIQYRSSE
jgi:hypothetical protein